MAAAISSSMSISSDAYRQILSRHEAKATVKLGKDLGIQFGDDEESVICKIMEMENQDEERLAEKGIRGGV